MSWYSVRSRVNTLLSTQSPCCNSITVLEMLLNNFKFNGLNIGLISLKNTQDFNKNYPTQLFILLTVYIYKRSYPWMDAN